MKDVFTCQGVDDWDQARWSQEVSGRQVLVMIHQVLLDALSRSYLKIPDLALIIIDECHHAVKVCTNFVFTICTFCHCQLLPESRLL